MKKLLSLAACCAGLWALLWAGSVSALAIPPAPSLAVPIVDQTGTLTPSQIQQLTQQIAASRSEKSYQIGILMIPTLGSGEYLEEYSIKVAREWGIGEKDKSNGVLILVVKDDRKMRIEVGRGLEGDLPDVKASRIVRNIMAPAFRSNDYVGGLSAAIDSIQKTVAGQADPRLAASTSSSSKGSWSDLIFFAAFAVIFVFSWVGSMLARSKSWWAGGIIGLIIGAGIMAVFSWAFWSIMVTIAATLFGFLFDFLVSRNYSQHIERGSTPSWWAGGGDFGGGGGFSGGGSFGGGGFSGGGSSGDW